jgi:hypothetical protein
MLKQRIKTTGALIARVSKITRQIAGDERSGSQNNAAFIEALVRQAINRGDINALRAFVSLWEFVGERFDQQTSAHAELLLKKSMGTADGNAYDPTEPWNFEDDNEPAEGDGWENGQS